jgi:trigger factor
VVGLKAAAEKTFDITFPADYGVQALQNRKVSFTVKINKVQEVIEPTIDDEFAAKVGPFKTVDEMKADIKKQLTAEKQQEADRNFADEVLTAVTKQSKVAIPQPLIDEQIDRLIADQRQNLTYRGQTWQEFLDVQELTEEKYREQLKPDAEFRVKAGLVLTDVAEKENITIMPDELEVRMQLHRGQYQDKQMQAELDKPEAKREIASRMLTEKTIDKLVGYAIAK